MAFTILTRDNEARRDAGRDATKPPVLSIHDGRAAEAGPSEPDGLRDTNLLDDGPLPPVILRLPDLQAVDASHRGRRFTIGSQLYWAAIVLGALLAMWLIASGKKPPTQSTGDPPTWTSPSPAPTASAAPKWSAGAGQPASQPPRWRADDAAVGAQPSGINTLEGPISQAEQPELPPAGASEPPRDKPEPAIANPPTSGEAAAPAEPPADTRTARAGEARWDGGARRAKPGEAAPLGITPVP